MNPQGQETNVQYMTRHYMQKAWITMTYF